MRIDRLETYDRLKHFKEQSFDISECCQDIIEKRPFGSHPFYIFAHARTDEDGVTKRLIWQPRLTKPKAQTNSMLFRAYPASDRIDIIWMIPAEELWKQFQEGKLLEDNTILRSIRNYVSHRDLLEKKEDGDLDDHQIDAIYRNIATAGKTNRLGLILPTQLPTV